MKTSTRRSVHRKATSAAPEAPASAVADAGNPAADGLRTAPDFARPSAASTSRPAGARTPAGSRLGDDEERLRLLQEFDARQDADFDRETRSLEPRDLR